MLRRFNRLRNKNKRGVVTLFIVFIMVAIIIILIGAVVAPLGAEFSTAMFTAGQGILNDTRADGIDAIADASIQTELNDSFNSAISSATDNIEFSTAIFKYSWLIILVLAGIIIFLFARRIVEYGGGFGFL